MARIAAFIISVVLLLAVTQELVAKGSKDQRARSQKVITIVDHTGPLWDGIIPVAVRQLNAAIPKNGPRLRYVRGAYEPCGESIDVCSGPVNYSYLAVTSWRGPKSRVQLTETDISPADMPGTACHELMHAITGIRDAYHTKENRSCVLGTLSHPGPFDRWYLRKYFSRE